MSWGDSFVSGFGTGAAIRDRRKQMKFDEARDAADRELRARVVEVDAQRWKSDRDAAAQREAARNALVQSQLEADAKRLAQERDDAMSDPVRQLARKKAQAELELMTQPKQPDELADLTRQRDIAQRKSEIAALGAPPVPPMAKVTQKVGDTTVVRDMPATDVERSFRTLGYKSPYGDDITELERQIAEQKSEIAGGDTRTGFLGLASSRQGIVEKANRKRLELKARELQDMLEKGIIDQAEADRRAALLMPQ